MVAFLVIGSELIFASTVLGTELLTNGNMETGSPPSNWIAFGLSSFAAEGTIVHGGSQSAKLIENNTTAGYIYQVVQVTAGVTYRLSGYIYDNDSNCKGYLRIDWYASSDGSGTSLANYSSSATTDSTAWQEKSFCVTAHGSANSARIKCYNESTLGTAGPTVYYDDISFVRINVKINEVLYDAVGVDTGKEWIELVNSGEYDVYIGGWDLDPAQIGYYTIPASSGTWDGTLDAGSFVVIHVRASGTDTATDLYHSSPTTNMGDTSASVQLYSSTSHTSNTIIDFMEYGAGTQTGEGTAVTAGIWRTAYYTPDVDAGHSIGLYVDGSDPKDTPTGNCGKLHDDATYPGNWDDFASPTPGESNNPSAIKIIIQKWRELYQ